VALCAIPIYFAFLDGPSALVLALVVPSLAVAAASAIRSGSHRQTSAAGEIAAIGVAFGAVITFWPWCAVLILLVAPLIHSRAERREQRLVSTRWEELHHDAGGDPAWIRAS
jgi:hypothetical protein